MRIIENWSSPSRQRRMAGIGFAAIALVPLLLLIVAGCLVPDPSGLGTHRQLGLPPCSMRVMFGVRCPACGMTTSWSHFARGDFAASLHANTGGFLLAWLAVALAVTSVQVCVGGEVPAAQRRFLGISAVVIGVVVLLDWGVRMA